MATDTISKARVKALIKLAETIQADQVKRAVVMYMNLYRENSQDLRYSERFFGHIVIFLKWIDMRWRDVELADILNHQHHMEPVVKKIRYQLRKKESLEDTYINQVHVTCDTEEDFVKDQICLLDSWEEAQQEDEEEPEEESSEVESERAENEALSKAVTVSITALIEHCPKMPDKLLKMLEHFKLASEHKQKA